MLKGLMHGRKYNFSSGKAYPFTCSHHDCEKLLASQTQTTHAFLLNHACVSLGSKCHWIYVTEDHDKQSMKICCSVSGYSQSGLPCCPHWRKSHGEKLPQGLRTASEKKATPVTLLRGCLPDFPTVSLLATTFFYFSSSTTGRSQVPPTGRRMKIPLGLLWRQGWGILLEAFFNIS